MIKEALEYLNQTLKNSATPFAFPRPANATRTRYLLPGGGVVELEDQPKNRTHYAANLDDFAKLVHSLAGADAAAIFVEQKQVVAVLDFDAHRDNKVLLNLRPTQALNALTERNLVGKAPVDFIRTLRRTLRDEFAAAAPGMESLIRNLKFQTTDSGHAQLAQGRESFGKELAAEVLGIPENLADELLLTIVPFSTFPEIRMTVRCLFDIDPTDRKVSLDAVPDALESAILDTRRKIAEAIEQVEPLSDNEALVVVVGTV